MSAYFDEVHLDINGVDTAVFTAGEGTPLVFFHGAGTVTGFDKLLALADDFRVVVAHHPGYGASADDTTIDNIHDYVRHHLDVLDRLGIDSFILAGHSMGGWMAATAAVYAGSRIDRLVLCAPAGLRVPEHPTVDLFIIPDEELLGWLSADMSVFEGHFTIPPTPAFLADRYRETTSTARIMWDRNYDPKLGKWLHRLTMPTLILWGELDRIIPVEQAAVWADLIPNSSVQTFANTGHLLIDERPEAVEAIRAFAKGGVAFAAD